MNPDRSAARGLSPDLNINRWSHSTTSSAGAVDGEFLHQMSVNPSSSRPAKAQVSSRGLPPLKSQYSQTPFSQSPGRSPGRPSRTTSRRASPESSRMPLYRQASSDHASALAVTAERETPGQRAFPNEGFGTTIIDHTRGANKYGQPVEGIALQFTSNQVRPKRSDQHKLGNNLYQATNSSHISLQKKPSHNRRRDDSRNGSRDTVAGGSISSIRSEHSKRGGHRSPTQKGMLSSALSKANQAVLLDNAHDVQGAISAYNEACDILQQVMVRSNDPEDRRKLSAIRETYSTRISELYDLDTSFEYLNREKELPEAPATTRYLEGQGRISFEEYEDSEPPPDPTTHHPNLIEIPMRQESLLPQIFGGERYLAEQRLNAKPTLPPLNSNNLNVPMDANYMPAPLSPRRPPSLGEDNLPTPVDNMRSAPLVQPGSGSISWLDTAGDNYSSASSRRSSLGPDPAHDGLISAIAADIDAVVNAAYDQDDHSAEPTPRQPEVMQFSHNFEPPTYQDPAHSLATQPSQESVGSIAQFEHLTREYLDEEGEEEEELLNMMMAEGFLNDENGRPEAMSSLPRQSDSSGFSIRSSGRTWESSVTTATQATTLSTLTESPEIPQQSSRDQLKDLEETTLPSQEADLLSRKQEVPLPALPTTEKPTAVGLRDRRMSGQGAAQLKIETFTRQGSVSQQTRAGNPALLDIPSASIQETQPELNRSASNTNMSISTLPLTPLTSIHSADSIDTPDHPPLSQLASNSTIGDAALDSSRSVDQQLYSAQYDNASSKPRNLSLSTNGLSGLPLTPGSALFPTHSRTGTMSTPAGPSPNVLSSTAVGGMYIFDHIPDTSSPSHSRSFDVNPTEPLPLEPCPDSFLLRPFWLMRCLYQTLAHPKGGYVSTKLFIPRDIWRVKGVKIKAIDDKVGQCDVLTAALLKLAKVDTLDADAVLEELQSFDIIIENVRQALMKKLGSDVGLTGSVVAMKNSAAGEEAEPISKTSSSVKSFASSWRKLRSKSSTTGLTPSLSGRRDTTTETTMSSLPMTSNSAVPTSRSHRGQKYAPPTPTSMPQIPTMNANYMSSLARLFDAVQVLDSIARQVEDPGLKATNKTQVGLELSMRGAAEFFSFYILRFAMADITMLIDKYLKRNGEWVMT